MSVFVLCLTAKAPVILVCGGKDIGKSTFARYLTNTFLNRYILHTVYFLIFYIIEWHYCAKIQLYIWYRIDQEMSFCPSVKTTVELSIQETPSRLRQVFPEFVVSHFLSAKVSSEWKLNLGFGTQKKCPFPLNRGVPSIKLTNTKIMWTFFQDQILCPLNRGVPWIEVL